MDISSIVASEREFEVKHPATSEPIGLTINLRPDSHPEVEKARRAWMNERLRKGKVTADKVEALNLSLIEAAVSGWTWEGDLNFEGEKPAFSPATLRKVLKALPWVRNQIDDELGDEAAFFQG